jgi:hypothetical protein
MPERDSSGRFVAGSGSSGGRVKIRIELDEKGIIELLQSADVEDHMLERAERVADAAGGAPDYEEGSFVGHDRARSFVRTATIEARRDEATNHTLLRAVDAARG